MTIPSLPEQIEAHRDRMWRRDEELRVESAVDAERFIADVGFANTLTDARRAGPSFRHRGVRSVLRFCCGGPFIWPAHVDDFQRAAKQRSELSPRRGFASLGLTVINLFGAAERRPKYLEAKICLTNLIALPSPIT